MRVLVAGATGAIGRPLISALVVSHQEVIGITSTERAVQTLRDRGAEAFVADALDRNAVESVIRKVRPEAVIDELTSLPKRYTPEEMKAGADRDRTVRLVGGRNVQNAAQAAGTKRYIVQSTGFFYGPGPGLAVERDALAVNASPSVASSVQTYMKIEERVLGARDLQGVALRYGFFYGPGTYHDPVNGSVSEQVRAEAYPVIGSGRGAFSFVHVEDAAVATVAALEAEPGVYNIVDDNPSEMGVWLPAFAQFLGAPPPPHITEEEALKAEGADAVYYATQLRGASNAYAKRELAFSPRKLEWLSTSKAAAK
ncbi:MAG: NAD(P)-dependent oxidoreductase [Acidobacteriia bacterium]|nr:NAD(P)-dependent oxidoreductase [Terriglobia bacterium]